MPKIYNEIVIDMNPESPTFEETLYEDSFEYSGDMMLMEEAWEVPDVDPTTLKITDANKYKEKHGDAVKVNGKFYIFIHMSGFQAVPAPASAERQKEYTDVSSTAAGFLGEGDTAVQWKDQIGAANIGKDDFVDPATGEMLDPATIFKTLKDKLPGMSNQDIQDYINDAMPRYEGVSKEDKGFLKEETRFAQREAGFAKDKAEDVYGLGVSAVGRERAGIHETYGLGVSAAGRAKEAGLGKLQAGAGQVGAQMRGAYGGMGGGARGAIGGQATMAKGLGQTVGEYTDKMTGLSGARERGLGAAEDEMTRLEQEKGYAGDAYTLAMDKAAFGERKGLYDLEEGAIGAYEADIAGTLQPEWSIPQAKEGGRVPDKESFSYFLTQLPDAGGN